MATVKALTVNQVAELFGISVSKIYADIRKGIITAHKGPSSKFILEIEDIKTVYGDIDPQDLEVIEHNLEDPKNMPNTFNKNLVIAILRQENRELTEQNKQILENHKIALENSRDLQQIIAENQTQLLQLITEGFQVLTQAREPNPQ
ncbi:MAG: helix-turn-helix domain-containing protein [Candidatus Poribacteria bacterium]|nr:helix-turn-helix domain-containing protein [Candidatus Poribacteria bacterium]